MNKIRTDKNDYRFIGKNNNDIYIFKNGAFWCVTVNNSLINEDCYYFKSKSDVMDLLIECDFI